MLRTRYNLYRNDCPLQEKLSKTELKKEIMKLIEDLDEGEEIIIEATMEER